MELSADRFPRHLVDDGSHFLQLACQTGIFGIASSDSDVVYTTRAGSKQRDEGHGGQFLHVCFRSYPFV
jgi:hypothetical protein